MVADTRAAAAARKVLAATEALEADRTVLEAIQHREDVARGLGFLAGVAATLVVGIGVVLLMRLAGG